MDDVTSLLQTAACTSRLLSRMDELMSWAGMKIKPSKSRSLSLRREVRNESTFFIVGGEKIPFLSEQLIKSLGRQYMVEFRDKHMGRTVMKPLSEGLAKFDQSQLPGKYKVWCYQFTLYMRVMWPLKMSEIPSSTASKMDGKANTFIRKWLGLPRCLSETSLFGRNTLQLSLQSISLGYKQEKTRLALELKESADQTVRNANPKVLTGQMWNAQTEVDQAVSHSQHQEIVGRVQKGRAWLGWGEVPLFWSMEAAYECMNANYLELAAECRKAGWKTTIYLVEVGCRGYGGLSTTRLLREVGVTGGILKKAIKELAEEAEKGSFWLTGKCPCPCHCSATRRRSRIKEAKHW